MINLVFDQSTDSSTTRGLHQPHGTRPDGTKGPLKFNDDDQFEGSVDITKDKNGNEVYAEATITIYEGRYRMDHGSNTEAVEEGMVSTFGHEAEHDLDPKQVQTTKNRYMAMTFIMRGTQTAPGKRDRHTGYPGRFGKRCERRERFME